MFSFRNKPLSRAVGCVITLASCVALATPHVPSVSARVLSRVVFSRNGAGPLTADTKVTRDGLRKLFAGYEIVPVVYSDEGGEARGFEVRRKRTRVLFIHVDGSRILRVGGYAPEVDSELGVRVGEPLGQIRAKIPSLLCHVDTDYGDGVLCLSPDLPNLRFRFDTEEKTSPVTMMEWVPPSRPGESAK